MEHGAFQRDVRAPVLAALDYPTTQRVTLGRAAFQTGTNRDSRVELDHLTFHGASADATAGPAPSWPRANDTESASLRHAQQRDGSRLPALDTAPRRV
jgi:hypothetical protein